MALWIDYSRTRACLVVIHLLLFLFLWSDAKQNVIFWMNANNERKKDVRFWGETAFLLYFGISTTYKYNSRILHR